MAKLSKRQKLIAEKINVDELYSAKEHDGDDDEDDGIVASAQIIYGIAWKEHEAQPKPLERGTATHKMTDIAVTKTKG